MAPADRRFACAACGARQPLLTTCGACGEPLVVDLLDPLGRELLAVEERRLQAHRPRSHWIPIAIVTTLTGVPIWLAAVGLGLHLDHAFLVAIVPGGLLSTGLLRLFAPTPRPPRRFPYLDDDGHLLEP